MAYPDTLDDFTPVVDGVDDVMDEDINDLQTAIEALEAKMGVDDSEVETSHDYKISSLEDAMQNGLLEPTGFPNRTDSTISFSNSSPDRTFSIQPADTNFYYYIGGIKYISTGDTVQITDVEGIHAIYYDGSTLTALANPTSAQIDDLIRNKALVSIIYWDTSTSTAIYVGEERHGSQMDGATHSLIHFRNGLAYIGNGLGLSSMSVDGTGITADAQFGIDAGSVSDEDIFIDISAIASTIGLPLYYMLGVNAEWQKHTEAGFSMRTVDGTPATNLAYNEFTGGAWQLTDVGSNDFVLCHVFATTEKDNPMIAIMGQEKYATRNAARAGAEVEILSLVLDDVLFPEIRAIATVIFQTNTSYANAINAKVVSTDEGDNYIDWRNTAISRTAVSTTDHNNLAGLQGGAAGEFYHFTSARHGILSDLADLTPASSLLIGDGLGDWTVITPANFIVDNSILTTSNTKTLTNKTIDADNNTISNIGDDELKAGIDAAKLGDGSVSNTEFQYLDGVTSAIQTQLDAKLESSGVGTSLPTASTNSGKYYYKTDEDILYRSNGTAWIAMNS